MTLWYDLSTSLGATGMSGTVRTELEVCRALQLKTRSLRFFRFQKGKIVVVDPHEYSWLSDATAPIGERFLEWLQRPRSDETREERDEHVTRLTDFATTSAPHPLDRGRNSLLYALAMLPPPVAETLLDALAPHSNATFQQLHRISALLSQRVQKAPLPEAETIDAPHPFAPGDAVFSVGIDWELTYLPLLRRIRKKTPIFIHQVVHDLTPIVVPQFHVERNCEVYREFFFNVSSIVDCAWYISHATRLDAEAVQRGWRMPVVKSRQLTWGSEAPKPDGRTSAERKALLQTKGIDRPFFLFVSTLEARKNHETVYRAYRQLLKERGPQIPQLVFVGHGGWKRSEFLGWLHRDPVIKGHLIHTRANDAELDALYRECLFTVYPSLYEGWGLPIVESHAYGKAVITSDAASLKEAAGDGVDAVEAMSVQAWRDVLEKYLFDAGHLDAVTQRQQQAFKLVSWADTADQILEGVKA